MAQSFNWRQYVIHIDITIILVAVFIPNNPRDIQRSNYPSEIFLPVVLLFLLFLFFKANKAIVALITAQSSLS